MILDKLLREKKQLIMGILNFTPDSFSDGGDFFEVENAVKQVKEMLEQGADIIDLGCESTRPNAVKVSTEDEIARVKKILPVLREKFPNILISIDTYKAEVAEFALQNGANILNDVLGAKNNNMAQVAAKYNSPIIIMHNGTVESSVPRLLKELQESIDICLSAGVPLENVIVDPGMGFGKIAEENILITRELQELATLGCKILYAVSRKRTTDYILGGNSKPKDRDIVSATMSLEAVKLGACIVRVHNVKVMREMLLTYNYLT